MSELSITRTRMKEGIWEALLRRNGNADDAGVPSVSVTLDGAAVEGVELIPDQEGGHVLRVPVPKAAISDGVQTCLVSEADTGERLGAFTLIAGEAVEDDIRAEIALLRAELDMLKRAFRRHCLETM